MIPCFSAVVGMSLLLVPGAQGSPMMKPDQQEAIAIPARPGESANCVPNDLQSFSFEFSFFPDFAGNHSHPNEFSKTLLGNLKEITGAPPVIRVGGTTQDRSEYIPSMKESVQNTFENPDDDQPIYTSYGPSFFESYNALGDFPYIHGLNFNLSLEQETSAATEACRVIGSNLHLLELGNEINMDPARYRPKGYSLDDYIREWNQRTTALEAAYRKACPGSFIGFMAPSFILPLFHIEDKMDWEMVEMFQEGYDEKNLTREISAHHYMETNKDDPSVLPPVSTRLQTVLMNHTSIITNLASHIQRAHNLTSLHHPYVLGEMNSIAKQGRNGETNVFGDALWLVDFSLWAAEHNIRRLHFHQGTDYRYGSWQPVPKSTRDGVSGAASPPTTNPPYYGQVMVAKALGSSRDTRIKNIPLAGDTNAAYAVFDGDQLARLVVLNMQAFNTTSSSGGRPKRGYKFQVPASDSDDGAGTLRARVERLTAAGSDAETGITLGGISYDYSLQQGKPVVLDDREEIVVVEGGMLDVEVEDSSAALLTFH